MVEESLKEFGEKYFSLLQGPLSGLNLTALDNLEEFYRKQILDSVLPLKESEKFCQSLLSGNKILVDIGFGGGFPILPLAYLRNDIRFLGFEAKKKKVEAVNYLKNQLDLPHVQLHHQRLEEIYFDVKCTVILKAVGSCKEFLKKIKSSTDLTVFFYKGPHFREKEGKDLAGILKTWDLVEEKFYELEGLQGRWIVGFKKRGVPHGTTNNFDPPGKTLVKLSDFL